MTDVEATSLPMGIANDEGQLHTLEIQIRELQGAAKVERSRYAGIVVRGR